MHLCGLDRLIGRKLMTCHELNVALSSSNSGWQYNPWEYRIWAGSTKPGCIERMGQNYGETVCIFFPPAPLLLL